MNNCSKLFGIGVELGDDTGFTVQLGTDGTMRVEGHDTVRVYDPATGVTGEATTVIDEDGSARVTSSSGTVTSISADGTTMTILGSDGARAVATEGADGVTVEVDGIVYRYEFE